ncbi:PREDICTED: inositol polyphosphate 1-phosphatase-like, partial [Amphimedon queenslandica]|uniref:inositol-1,4-bisphosphate 1-phosphatase n=1 Tax=Amphimedon queenslandica TaxID=400682 RepID=A0AAN0IUN0_AMPQE
MLSRLLDSKLAGALAETIHKEMKTCLKEEDREKVKLLKYLDERQLGVWIDPLDSTNEYVRGVTGSSSDGLYSQSIHCVTTLVGVFDRITGKPLIGVINQPFHSTESEGVWCGWSLWGISEEGLIGMSSPLTPVRKGENLNKKICL